MIPSASVDLSWDVDLASLQFPSEAEIEQGFLGTRQYSSQFVLDADWNEAVECLDAERDAVGRMAAQASDEETFDELARDAETDLIMDEVVGDLVTRLDLGVQAACVALCAAGCVTGASCRGHVGPH